MNARATNKLLDTGPSPKGWHRLQTMLECAQKFAYAYGVEEGAGHRQKEKDETKSPALIRGSLMHLILAHHYMRIQARQQGTDPNEWMDPTDAVNEMCLQKGGDWAKHADVIHDCYAAYRGRWATEEFKVLEVERLAYAKIKGHLFTGRFDLVIEDRRGEVWVIDHKTSSRLTATQRKYYGVSGQLIGYSYLGQQIYGEKFAGLMLNQIQHTKPCKFARIPLPPAPNLLRKFPQIVDDAETRIQELRASGRKEDSWPMAANELTCFHRYGACKFLDRCRWGTDMDE